MKFLVIGLGNLGRAIAENLTRIGDEVIGVDLNLHKVEAVKQTISGSVSLDTTDRDALNTLPLSEMDAIFVTYGKNFWYFGTNSRLIKEPGCRQADRPFHLSHP